MLLRLLSHEHLLFFFSIVILDSISFFKAGCTQISNIGIIVLILLQNLLFHHVVVLTSCISSMLVPLSLILLILSLFHAEVHHIFKALILSITGLLHLECLSTCLMNFLLHPRFFKLEHFNTVLYELCFYRQSHDRSVLLLPKRRLVEDPQENSAEESRSAASVVVGGSSSSSRQET